MFKSNLSRLLLLATSFTLPLTIQARCSTFRPGSNPYSSDVVYTSAPVQRRVSAIVNCTGDAIGTSSPMGSEVTRNCNATNCGIASPADFVLEINSTLSVDVPDDQRQSLFDLIKLSTDRLNSDLVDVNVTMFHEVGQVGTCLSEGDAGYWTFAPLFYCVQGVLDDCSDSVASLNNQTITACGVKLLDAASYDGTLLVTRTSGVEPQPAPANATASAPNTTPTINGASSERQSVVAPVLWIVAAVSAAVAFAL